MPIAVRVYDPAMCCSTGICGPSVDPQLVRFAADLDWLKTQGASVERFNLSQQPAAFADDAAVKSALETKGEAGLPLVKVNGEVVKSGTYPSRDELAAWAGVGTPVASIFTEAVSELAEQTLRRETADSTGTAASSHPAAKAKSGGCCGPKAEEGTEKKSGCC